MQKKIPAISTIQASHVQSTVFVETGQCRRTPNVNMDFRKSYLLWYWFVNCEFLNRFLIKCFLFVFLTRCYTGTIAASLWFKEWQDNIQLSGKVKLAMETESILYHANSSFVFGLFLCLCISFHLYNPWYNTRGWNELFHTQEN